MKPYTKLSIFEIKIKMVTKIGSLKIEKKEIKDTEKMVQQSSRKTEKNLGI